MATSSFCEEENLPLSHSESEWNPEQVAKWLRRVQPEYEEEARLFEKAEITGKALAIVDRQCLKDIGIASIGKQLTILGCIKELMSDAIRHHILQWASERNRKISDGKLEPQPREQKLHHPQISKT